MYFSFIKERFSVTGVPVPLVQDWNELPFYIRQSNSLKSSLKKKQFWILENLIFWFNFTCLHCISNVNNFIAKLMYNAIEDMYVKLGVSCNKPIPDIRSNNKTPYKSLNERGTKRNWFSCCFSFRFLYLSMK